MLLYRATDITQADSVSGTTPEAGGPWDLPRPGVTLISRPTSRAGIYAAIRDALVAAGYTAYNLGISHDSFHSLSENGVGDWYFEMELSGGRYLHFNPGTHINDSNIIQAGIRTAGNETYECWDLGTSEFTSDLHILVDLDSFVVAVENINHTSPPFTCILGLTTNVDSNSEVLMPTSPVTAGEFLTIPLANDAVALGYSVNDKVRFVNQDPFAGPAAESTWIISLNMFDITVRRLENNYGMAKVGARALPVIRFVSNGVELSAANNVLNNTRAVLREGFSHESELPSDYAQVGGFPIDRIYWSIYSDFDPGTGEFGSGSTPQQRTLRHFVRGNVIGTDNLIIGSLPKVYAFNGTTQFYPHEWHNDDRKGVDLAPFRTRIPTTQTYLMGYIP